MALADKFKRRRPGTPASIQPQPPVGYQPYPPQPQPPVQYQQPVQQYSPQPQQVQPQQPQPQQVYRQPPPPLPPYPPQPAPAAIQQYSWQEPIPNPTVPNTNGATRTKYSLLPGIVVALLMLTGTVAGIYFTFFMSPIPNSTQVIRYLPLLQALMFLMIGIGLIDLQSRRR